MIQIYHSEDIDNDEDAKVLNFFLLSTKSFQVFFKNAPMLVFTLSMLVFENINEGMKMAF